MIKIEKTKIYGWEEAVRGMRNPMNSWDRSDSDWKFVEDPSIINPNDEVKFVVGENDHDLMMRLAKGGAVHAKYRRMISVYVDITAPLYWWKEFDTYKLGTVANSCSTMHKIHERDLTLADFSHEHLSAFNKKILLAYIDCLNTDRQRFVETKDKDHWWQIIQMLPSSFNQKRTIMLNYEVLVGMYRDRKNHKLDEWHTLCDWIESLPYSEFITLNGEK